MRAVRRCDAGRGRGVEVVEVPAPTGDGIRVRIRSAGICGSDLHLVRSPFHLPHTLGHEMAGLLDDDTPVAIEPLLPCGGCEQCRRGDYNLCAGAAGLLGAGRDGGMADELRVPERCLVPLPRGVAVENACLVEPLAVAVHGMARAGLHSGHRVAVVGGGSIGLCAVAVARAAGAEVALVARHEPQREAGDRLGAGEAGDGYDLVVDAAGTAGALERAVELCRPGGCLLLLATYWDGLELPGFAVCMKEVRVLPSSMYGRPGVARDVDVAAGILGAQPALPDTLITHRFPLDAARHAFDVANDRRSGAIKVVLEP